MLKEIFSEILKCTCKGTDIQKNTTFPKYVILDCQVLIAHTIVKDTQEHRLMKVFLSFYSHCDVTKYISDGIQLFLFKER